MKNTSLVIGSRGSDLALWQANHIRDILVTEYDCDVQIQIIRTAGDRLDQLSFEKMEGKGFFTKELEEALLSSQVDLAVHSLKDLMTTQPDGLMLGAVGFRADRRDMLLARPEVFTGEGLLPIQNGSVVGTSSARRKCQIAAADQSLVIKDLRGNVPTRVQKLRDGDYDAIVIAAAGIHRLRIELSDMKRIPLDPELFLPAPAQGVLGLQIRSDDARTKRFVAQLGSEKISVEVLLERGLLARFDAGCSLPLGVFSRIEGKQMYLSAILGTGNPGAWSGLRKVNAEGDDVASLVTQVYEQLTRSGEPCVSE